MRFFSCYLGIATSILAVSSTLLGQEAGPRRIRQTISETRTKRLAGDVHPLAKSRYETGTAPADLPMEHMMLVLTRSTEQQSKLDSLVNDLHDPASTRFHQWLTPERFGQEFGVSDEDIQTITGWLQSHGFQVAPVPPGRTFLEFSGTAIQVKEAFHTELHQYTVNGEIHWANASDPEIPEALTPVVAGIATLHNFGKKAQLKGRFTPEGSPIQTAVQGGISPQYTSSSGAHYLSPADYAVIYNMNPLYQAGITGAGRTIAVVARTNINVSDINDFRSTFGLPTNPPQVILNGRDPGNLGGDEEAEAVLDTSWAGAIAKGATIKVVVSRSTNTADGVDLSEAYIINNNLSDVMTESFGDCEANYTSAQATLYSSLAAQAAAQGITYLVASGDSGAAGCDSPTQTAATHPISVNILASNPYVMAVGGTQLNDTNSPSSYWASSNSSTRSSALSYIPEVVWNESCAVAQCGQSSGLWASSGGASTFYAKPSWQSGVTGIPSDGARDLPDVSLTASGHDAYLVCINHSCPNSSGRIAFSGYSGTSAATPSFAGVIALIAQKAGSRQGQADFNLYRLAAAQNMTLCNASGADIVSSGSSCIFNDVTVGNNAVPGETDYGTLTAKYQAGVGYDQATGLGSVNVANLVNNWNASTVSLGTPIATLSATSLDFRTLAVGLSSTQSVTVTNDGTASLTISSISLDGAGSTSFSQTNNCPGVLPVGTSCTISVVFAPRSVGSFTGSLSVVDNASGSPRTLSLTGSGTATVDISVSSTNLSFSGQKVQSRSAAQPIQIVNSTPQTVAISGVDIGGTNAADFSLANTCGSTLAPGESCTVNVIFTPQFPGSRSAVVTVRDGVGTTAQTISLTGTGTLTGSFEIVNGLTGEVLDLANGSIANNALVQQSLLNGTASQQWQFVSAAGGSYAIVNSASGKALDNTNGSSANGNAVQQYDYLGGGNQQWQLVPMDDVHYRIVNVGSGKVLDVPNGTRQPGTPIQQWDYDGAAQQLWTLVPPTSYNLVNSGSGAVLDVVNGSSNSGTLIQQFTSNGNKQQQWQFIPTGAGFYAIMSRLTGKVMDVTRGSAQNGAAIQEFDYLNSANQQWQLVPVDGTRYAIRSRSSGKVLDMSGASTASGALLQLWDYTGGSNQLWQVTPVLLYTIANRNSGDVLDVPGGAATSGIAVQQYGSNNRQQQRWQLVSTGSGYYAILNDLTGKALDVASASNASGALIQQYDYLGSANQQWQLVSLAAGYYEILSKQSGKAMDVIGASMLGGALIQQYTYMGGANQQWMLTAFDQ